jgi:hypothetical protein
MSAIPALDRMGADLEAALRSSERRSWWRTHPLIAIAAVFAAIAVPAVGSRVDWAGLVHGETALPSQAASHVRVVLASGDRFQASAWQLVVYKARIGTADGTGPVGLCAYVTLTLGSSGVGQCVAKTGAPDLLMASRGDSLDVIAGLVTASASRVELTLADGRRLAVAPQTANPAALASHGLPGDLRYFVVSVADFGIARVGGIRVLDAAGNELARSGRPRPLPESAPVLRSPVSISPEEGP